MPAQEPAGGDKDDDVDLPSEDTDGSRGCFLPAGEAPALLALWHLPACSPPRPQALSRPICFPRVKVGMRGRFPEGLGRHTHARALSRDSWGGGAFTGAHISEFLPWESGGGIFPLYQLPDF